MALPNSSLYTSPVVSAIASATTARPTPTKPRTIINGGVSSKLRLLCSYGGQIVPKPHDNSFCYIGGYNSLVVVERNSTFASLAARLSNFLLNGRSFTLKYRLPKEDFECLISVETDEDLANMIEEYDHSKAASKRLRLFLFVTTNGVNNDKKLGFPDRLLGLQDNVGLRSDSGDNKKNLDSNVIYDNGVVNCVEQQPPEQQPPPQNQRGQDVKSLPNANQPQVEEAGDIRTKQELRPEIEEQLAQSNVGNNKQLLGQFENGFAATSSPPPKEITLPAAAVSAAPIVSSELPTKVFTEPEQLTPELQLENLLSHHANQLESNCRRQELLAPNSHSSSPSHMCHQEEPLSQTTSDSTVLSSLTNPSDPNTLVAKTQEPTYISPPPQPPQVIHIVAPQYIHHQGLPVMPCIHIYPPQQQPCHIYLVMSTAPPTPYNVSKAPWSLQAPLDNKVRDAPSRNPEMGHVGAYTTTPNVGSSQVVQQIPTNNQESIGYSHIHDAAQSSSTVNANFENDYAHSLLYCTQPMRPLPSSDV